MDDFDKIDAPYQWQELNELPSEIESGTPL